MTDCYVASQLAQYEREVARYAEARDDEYEEIHALTSDFRNESITLVAALLRALNPKDYPAICKADDRIIKLLFDCAFRDLKDLLGDAFCDLACPKDSEVDCEGYEAVKYHWESTLLDNAKTVNGYVAQAKAMQEIYGGSHDS